MKKVSPLFDYALRKSFLLESPLLFGVFYRRYYKKADETRKKDETLSTLVVDEENAEIFL